jgi:ribosomal protein L37AE/L43A
MQIKKIIDQHRRDFTAVYVCEHCGAEETGPGYDDANFHKNVVPEKVCKVCGLKAGSGYRPLATRYPEGFQV